MSSSDETFASNLINTFTLMCRKGNCPVTSLQYVSQLPAKQVRLNCPFTGNPVCAEITDDDWVEVFRNDEYLK